MKETGTAEAFSKMIQERAIHKKLGVGSDAVRAYRQKLKKDEVVSLDLMEEMLKRAGWKKVVVEVWEIEE